LRASWFKLYQEHLVGVRAGTDHPSDPVNQFHAPFTTTQGRSDKAFARHFMEINMRSWVPANVIEMVSASTILCQKWE
jgi:hypothetical protein